MDEKYWLLSIQQNRPEFLDPFLQKLTLYNTILTILVLLFLAYKVYVRRTAPVNFFRIPFFSVISASLLANLIKILIQRPRPFTVLPGVEQLTAGGGFSFPSGHTTEVFALFFSVWWGTRNRILGILLFLWAIIIAYTRMAFGVHYPSDILGGFLLGMLVSRTVYIYFKKKEKTEFF